MATFSANMAPARKCKFHPSGVPAGLPPVPPFQKFNGNKLSFLLVFGDVRLVDAVIAAVGTTVRSLPPVSVHVLLTKNREY